MSNIFNQGEFELIARLTAHLPASSGVAMGVGDDCAVLELDSHTSLLATCDSQVEGVHFTFETSSPEQIGRKALAVNLSDIAAMGGIPRYALISLILPPHLSLTTLDALYAGLRMEAETYEISIVGGNISGSGKGEQLVIDITLLGTVERRRALLRSGAQIGDLLCVTGFPGNSAAGLYTLLHPDRRYPRDAQEQLQALHRTPQPRIQVGRLLNQFAPDQVTAALDISDGLSGDLAHLCERSSVGARLDLARLPLSPPLRALAESISFNPYTWILQGGEDYELLFTIAPGYEQEILEHIQAVTAIPVTIIGTITSPATGMQLLYPDGHSEQLQIKSWNHLQLPER